ncbi:tripartite tricarboxylate transporter substrate binding protein [Polynucleobacter sp. UK-Mo-2m-Kol15]|uniref:Bug family tripartite tricarboxylate transporter substrate binding protein n=1 Tax=Polynucleobacter sp. UK-Mo-2m-Kol15 TaxID=2576916 RepID=UPI001C0E377E|nr:tripartite tricarboxylate transporter substrate binding protein [Polynucleobacter sp. UK-Mo-2m-Kol15]MBU3574977.1 tripartite tricarboxylate transporter substrate binding protein [Polynucleobacter sp. UK-Mo-2m-Kol15]
MKSFLLRKIFITMGAFASLACLHNAVNAQPYPNRPIKVIVPASAGGGADFITRTISNQLGDYMGQSIVVENKSGASGTIAAEFVSKSQPNGYTILMAQSTSTVIAPHLYKNLNYDTLKDLVPVTQVAQMPFVVVINPKVPANNVKEFIAYAKANPGKLNYSTSGNGAGSHLAGEMFNSATGASMVHVPYKGAGPALNAVVAGEVEVAFIPIVNALPLVKDGRLKAMAVTTITRSLAAKDIPTLAEAGLTGYDINTWFGMFVATNTPPQIVDQIYKETARAIKQPEIRDRFLREGADPIGSTPAEFSALVKTEFNKFAKVVKDSGIKID